LRVFRFLRRRKPSPGAGPEALAAYLIALAEFLARR
jgi:hypothetical protein